MQPVLMTATFSRGCLVPVPELVLTGLMIRYVLVAHSLLVLLPCHCNFLSFSAIYYALSYDAKNKQSYVTNYI